VVSNTAFTAQLIQFEVMTNI